MNIRLQIHIIKHSVARCFNNGQSSHTGDHARLPFTMPWVYNLERHDPNSHIPRVIGVSLAFSITAFLAVCLRFYIRLRGDRKPWVDDYAAAFTAMLAVGYAGIAIAGAGVPFSSLGIFIYATPVVLLSCMSVLTRNRNKMGPRICRGVHSQGECHSFKQGLPQFHLPMMVL